MSTCREHPSEVLLVDGYNLIKTDPLLRRRERFGLEAARQALEQRLHTYAQRTSACIILFFDGEEALALPDSAKRTAAFQVVFSRFPQKADELLKQAIQQRHGAKQVRLITSDRDIRHYARQHKIRSSSSSQFIDELARPIARSASKTSPFPPPELDPELTLEKHEIDAWEQFFQQRKKEG